LSLIGFVYAVNRHDRLRHSFGRRGGDVCHHGRMRPVDLMLTSRRHIDLVRVAGAGC
jgi:hypothetical protein